MGFSDSIKRQLRSVIEWQDGEQNHLFYRWTDNGDEIKNASKLLIKPGQGCVFVYRGKIRAMHHRPGLYNLKTDNIPFITTLVKVMQFFESEHKVGLYFFRLSKVLDQKWGTRTPVLYQDPIYQFPVGLRAYGNYSYQLLDPRRFFAEILGSQEQLSLAKFKEVVSPRLLQPISSLLAQAGYSYAELDAQREQLSEKILQALQPDLQSKLAIKLTDFRIEGLEFDQDTKARIERVASITADSIAAKQAGVSFAELKRLEALQAAAENESGAAGAGVGIGAGIGLGQQMAGELSKPSASQDDPLLEKMAKLKQMFELGMITEQEYSDKKRQLLAEL